MTEILERTPTLKPDTSASLPDHPDTSPMASPTESRPALADEQTGRMLLTRLTDLPHNHPDRPRIRERAILTYLPLAEHLTRRFRHRGETTEDLNQVAYLGLIKAIDGYDPTRGTEFTSYAIPTIIGELKRHFRDKGWAIRVPRRLQELKLDITKATTTLTQQLGRTPTTTDIAHHLNIPETDVTTGIATANAYTTRSLHTPITPDDNTEIIDLLGDTDPHLTTIEHRQTLQPLLTNLPHREQHIIALRFYANLTQTQIADHIGISQMHVSRLLTRTLTQLRQQLLTDD